MPSSEWLAKWDGVLNALAREKAITGVSVTVSIEEVEAALRDLLAEQEWRSIESAPRDGTPILALRGGDVEVLYWGKASHIPMFGWLSPVDGVEDKTYRFPEPTLWLPLPAPGEIKHG